MRQHDRSTTWLAGALTAALALGGASVPAVAAPADGERAQGLAVVAGVAPGESGIVGAGRGAARGDLPRRDGATPGGERVPESSTRISAASMAGAVDAFALSPDGATAVYIADQEVVNRFELYRVPVDGSAAPVKLSAALTFGTGDEGVASFRFSPDGSRVVFLADPTTGGGSNDLYSVPLDLSSAAVRLNPTAVTPVAAYGITPDGGTVLFFGPDSTSGSGATELYARAIAGGGTARQLSDAGAGNPAGGVVLAIPSPDGSRVVYAADASGVEQWYSVATAASGPGTDVQLSTALGSIGPAAVSPDGTTVVYAADDQTFGAVEVFAVPIAGGTRTKLNPSMAGSGATDIAISADGARVGYLADQNTAGVIEVYGADIDVAGSGVRLNSALSGTQSADALVLGPDSATAVYESDQQAAGTFDLYCAPLSGEATPVLLHDVTTPTTLGYFVGLGTPIIGNRAVYPAIGDTVDMFSVPYDGSGPFSKINDTIPVGDAILNAFLPDTATRLLAYGQGQEGSIITKRVYVAAVRDDLPIEQVNGPYDANDLGVFGYEIAASETHVVYLQDELTAGKLELFSRALDSDADGIANPSDNCPFVANAGQGSIVFGQTLLAEDDATFAWSAPADVRWARGPLSGVGSLVADLTGTAADATSITDDSSPLGSGAGFWYLVATDCDGRSWQTALGAEPARDAAALP